MASSSVGVMPPGSARAPPACAASIKPFGLTGEDTNLAPADMASRACFADIWISAGRKVSDGVMGSSLRFWRVGGGDRGGERETHDSGSPDDDRRRQVL